VIYPEVRHCQLFLICWQHADLACSVGDATGFVLTVNIWVAKI
jgi:hypothetical protein